MATGKTSISLNVQILRELGVDFDSMVDALMKCHDINTILQILGTNSLKQVTSIGLFKWAAANGHLEVVKVLLADPRVNPADDGDYAIRCAAINGHVKVVEVLLTDVRVNPAYDENYAIRWAAISGHFQVVKVLSADPRVNLLCDEVMIKGLVADPRVPIEIREYISSLKPTPEPTETKISNDRSEVIKITEPSIAGSMIVVPPGCKRVIFEF
ncbi:Ankyrin repeat protein [uncultured virus]|nr:Ankyrin repeat protein [uncultured virus]